MRKEGEGNRTGQRKKLGSDAGTVKTSGDLLQGALELDGPSELLPVEVRELGLQTPMLSVVGYRLVLEVFFSWQGCPTFWCLCATLEEEELSWVTH